MLLADNLTHCSTSLQARYASVPNPELLGIGTTTPSQGRFQCSGGLSRVGALSQHSEHRAVRSCARTTQCEFSLTGYHSRLTFQQGNGLLHFLGEPRSQGYDIWTWRSKYRTLMDFGFLLRG